MRRSADFGMKQVYPNIHYISRHLRDIRLGLALQLWAQRIRNGHPGQCRAMMHQAAWKRSSVHRWAKISWRAIGAHREETLRGTTNRGQLGTASELNLALNVVCLRCAEIDPMRRICYHPGDTRIVHPRRPYTHVTTPKYLALNVKAPTSAIQYLGDVATFIDAGGPEAPAGPEHPGYKIGTKLVMLKQGRLWALTEPVVLGAISIKHAKSGSSNCPNPPEQVLSTTSNVEPIRASSLTARNSRALCDRSRTLACPPAGTAGSTSMKMAEMDDDQITIANLGQTLPGGRPVAGTGR